MDTLDRIDRIDRKILAELMRDSSISIARLAERVGLSQTPCWKRVQKLEERGIITGRVALVDPARIGFGLTVFVGVEAPDHTAAWRDSFSEAIQKLPEVLETYRMAGDLDYLLRVAVSDMSAYDGFYRRLTSSIPIKTVTSRFAMERIKAETAYPIDTTSR